MAPRLIPDKIYVAGLCAAGKSTFSRKLAQRTGLPVYHMDTFIWKSDWKEASQEEIEACVRDVLKTDGWIIEGWIRVEEALYQADLVIHLDTPRWRLAWQEFMRFVEGQFKIRAELPEGCKDDFDIGRIRWLLTQEDPTFTDQLSRVSPEKLVRLTSRAQQKNFLENL